MSSNSFVNSRPSPQSAGDRLLMILKTRGPQTAGSLGAALTVTGEAARQRLARLAEAGLVEGTAEPRGVGRPAQVWRLTAAGHNRFPDAHSGLAVQLISDVRRELGEGALTRLIEAHRRQTCAAYLREMNGAVGLADRIARLAGLRTAEGYMAEWSEELDGSFLLVEHHCPIREAAAACDGLCGAELAVFEAVLGGEVTVERGEHVLAGGSRCAYRIRSAGRP